MIVVIHVIIAVLSMATATFGYIKPTINNLHASYALIALTLVSGFALVMSGPTSILRTCLSGLVYLAIVSVAVLLTRRKLSLSQSESAEITQ